MFILKAKMTIFLSGIRACFLFRKLKGKIELAKKYAHQLS